MALEPSEIFTASAMCFTEERLNNVIDRGVLGVVHFFEYAKEKAEQDVEIPEMRSQWLDFFNNPDSVKSRQC